MSDDYYGPQLPPNLQNSTNSLEHPVENYREVSLSKKSNRHKRKHSDSSTSSSTSDQSSSDDINESSRSQSTSKPAATTNEIRATVKVYGPCLLPGQAPESTVVDTADSIIGPVLPPHLAAMVAAREKERVEEEEEELMFGPRPSGLSLTSAEAAAAEIEERSKRMRSKLLGLDVPEDTGEAQRETWMIDLPPELVPNFGVTARQFRTKAPTTERGADRSSWTDTPADKARREQDAREGKQPVAKKVSIIDHAQAKKDREYAALVEDYNKSVRAKSLMDLHTDKLQDKEPTVKTKDSGDKEKKKKDKHKEKHREKDREDKHSHKHKDKKKDKHDKHKEKEKDVKRKQDKKDETVAVVVRKPFDRELDLKSNRMDAAARKSLIGKSHQLGGRFGHGSAQFL